LEGADLDSWNASNIASSEETEGGALCFFGIFKGLAIRVIGSGKQVGHSFRFIEYFFLQY
jgi:hypothetical protein